MNTKNGRVYNKLHFGANPPIQKIYVGTLIDSGIVGSGDLIPLAFSEEIIADKFFIKKTSNEPAYIQGYSNDSTQVINSTDAYPLTTNEEYEFDVVSSKDIPLAHTGQVPTIIFYAIKYLPF